MSGPRSTAAAHAAPGAHASRAAPPGLVVAAFAAVYVVWGSTYLAIKIAVETLPPFLMAGSRFILAGSLIYALCRIRGAPRPEGIHWRNASVIGGLLLLGGNGAVCGVAHLLPSGISSLLIATTPFWMVVIDWRFAGGPRPGARILLGLLAGFGGLALLIGPGRNGGNGVHLPAALILLLGALSWSAGSIFARGARLPESRLQAIGMEQLAGGAMMLAVGLLAGEAPELAAQPVSSRSIVAFVYLLVFGSLVGFTAYIWILGVSTPARVSTYAYVNPVIAVFLGWALAGEAVSGMTLVAAAIIIGAVTMVTLDRGRIVGRGRTVSRNGADDLRGSATAPRQTTPAALAPPLRGSATVPRQTTPAALAPPLRGSATVRPDPIVAPSDSVLED